VLLREMIIHSVKTGEEYYYYYSEIIVEGFKAAIDVTVLKVHADFRAYRSCSDNIFRPT
jgi:hypothetical protein